MVSDGFTQSRRRWLLGVMTLLATVAAIGGASSFAGDPTPEPWSRAAAAEPGAVLQVWVSGRFNGKQFERREWIVPTSGSWRVEDGEQVRIYDEATYRAYSRDGFEDYTRSGSRDFVGHLTRLSASLAPIRAFLAGRTTVGANGTITAVQDERGKPLVLEVTYSHGQTERLVVERTLSPAAAATRQLFEIAVTASTSRDVEVRPGEKASAPIIAYWFGPRVGEHRAVAAMQSHTVRSDGARRSGAPARSDFDLHVTYYELPGVAGSSALPGHAAPEGEIQLTSQPIDAPHAAYVLRVFNGEGNGDLPEPRWPREEIRLANGESAVLLENRYGAGFYVLTATTLVFATGVPDGLTIREAAEQLRPL